MGKLTNKLDEKLNGKAWIGLKDKFLGMCNEIVDASPDARGELTTVYVKFTIDSSEESPVYAVAWFKNSQKWIVGLALPDTVESPIFVDPPKRYIGLTKYFYIESDTELPSTLLEWAEMAYKNKQAH